LASPQPAATAEPPQALPAPHQRTLRLSAAGEPLVRVPGCQASLLRLGQCGTPRLAADPRSPDEVARRLADRALRDPVGLPQVIQIRLRGKRRAGRAAQRLLWRELAAEGVHVLAEPLAQRRELAAADLLLELGEIAPGRLPDLHRRHRPDEIRREVADRAARPVDVLQDAVPV